MSVRSFFGIRYASLENGQRFDLPVPVEAPSDLGRTSPYAQTEDVPIFPQLPSRLSEHMGSPEGLMVEPHCRVTTQCGNTTRAVLELMK